MEIGSYPTGCSEGPHSRAVLIMAYNFGVFIHIEIYSFHITHELQQETADGNYFSNQMASTYVIRAQS